jgi:subtilisin family serine protease
MKARMAVLMLTVTLSASLNVLRSQPSSYSYPYREGFISLSPTEESFLIKFSDDTLQTVALNQLQRMGMTLSRTILTLSGERVHLVRSSKKDMKLLQLLKELPGVIWASPVFRYQDGKQQVVLNTFVVKFKPEVSESEITFLNATYAVSIEREDACSSGGRRFLIKHPWGNNVDVFKLSNEYSRLPTVEYAIPDFLILDALDTGGPNDPYYANQWALAKINAEGAWEITEGSASVKIAVVDDGIDLEHEDLAGKLVGGYDAFQSDTIPSPSGNDAHGTACAGLIGAKTDNGKGVAGLARQCMVMPIRAGQDRYIYVWAATAGINWAVSHGADVISNSWGGGSPNQDLEEAINNAATSGRGGKGCIVCFSAGNIGGAVQ